MEIKLLRASRSFYLDIITGEERSNNKERKFLNSINECLAEAEVKTCHLN